MQRWVQAFAWAICLLLATRLATAAPPATVSLDLTELDAATFDAIGGATFERIVVVRLVQSGFAVVGPQRNPAIRLVVTKREKSLVLRAVAPSKTEERDIGQTTTRASEIHLEAAHKAVELVRSLEQFLEDPVAATVETPSAPSPPQTGRPPEPEKPLRPSAFLPNVSLDAGAGILMRRGGPDPVLRLLARWWPAPHWGLPLVASLVPASASAIRVLEWQVETGVSYAVAGETWHLDVGPVVGLLVHSFAVEGRDSGTRLNVLGAIGASFALRLSPLWHLGVHASAGFADSGRIHRRDSETLWERGPTRLDGVATLGAHW